MGRLEGKTCFITGAAQGIGRSICDRFLEEGATVVAADLRFDHPPQGPRLTHLRLDATDEAAITSVAAQHQSVNVLVNCVGYVASGDILGSSLDDFDRSVAINVRSMVLTTRAFLPAMLERRHGAIINIASVVSSVMAARTGSPTGRRRRL